MRKDRYRLRRSVWRRGDKAARYASPRHPGERERRDGGFTLLELLVAITLLGLMVTLIFAGLRFGTRAWEAADERIDTSSELQVVQSFMRRQLGRAYPLDVTDPGAEARIAFEGARDGVAFATLMPAHLGLGGFYWLSIHAERSGGGARLVASWRLFEPGTDGFADEAEAETTVLVDRISGVEFSYFGPADQGQTRVWHDRWEDAESLPSLVRVRVEFPEDDGRSWPELIAAPMLNQRR